VKWFRVMLGMLLLVAVPAGAAMTCTPTVWKIT
jgi:hypothetical protein